MGEKKALKVIENVENLLIEMNRFKLDILKRHEKEILEIIFAIAEKIIHYQIDASDEIIKESIIQALRLTVDKSQVVLRVNPEDYDYVEKLRPDLFSKTDQSHINDNPLPGVYSFKLFPAPGRND